MPEIPVEPLAAAPQAPAPAAPVQPPPEEEPASLPPALLEVPALQAVIAGAPPAVSMKIEGSEDRDEVKLLSENKDALLQAGFDFYRSFDGKTGVMFNTLQIHLQDLQAADRQGKLKKIAPDFDLVNHEVSKMGAKHPINAMQGAPTGPATPTGSAPPQAATGNLPLMPPPSAGVAKKFAAARIANMNPGAPTSGPEPGAGRLLNSVIKGVV